MPVDLTNPGDFNQFWEALVEDFRYVAIDQSVAAGDAPLDALNDHVTGPVTASMLASQYAYPIVWTVPQSWSPAYATTATDQGELQMQVVVFCQDTDPSVAFEKARFLGGAVVDNVEDDRALLASDGPSRDGSASAAAAWLTNFQMDFRTTPGTDRQQLRYCQMIFNVDGERRYK